MAEATGTRLAGDPAAHALLREAHDRGYRYPEDFGGFEADLTFAGPSEQTSGSVRISSARSVELTIVASDAARSWLRRELGSMIGHRWHLPYEEADGANTLELGPDDDDDPTGVFIDVKQDKYDSSYRVLDGEISQVNRAMGKIRFSIQIQDRAETPDGHTLPAHFTVFYWDNESGRLNRSDVYRDVYQMVDGVALPVSRQIITADDDGIATRRMDLSNHKLLESSENTDPAGGQLEYRAH
ncbi:MAG: DUF3386 family protein [Thermomicrobiales bacterium]